jgi:hypothetical protein
MVLLCVLIELIILDDAMWLKYLCTNRAILCEAMESALVKRDALDILRQLGDDRWGYFMYILERKETLHSCSRYSLESVLLDNEGIYLMVINYTEDGSITFIP